METNSGDDHSDDGLRIVIDSPRPKKRSKKELDESDKKIIESVEKVIEENLEEKAAKANLTAKNVKNIIKEVVTNEHVLALVRHAENPDNNDELVSVYEPKYTRAKTKELLSTSTPQKILPWMSPTKSVSEVQMLFTEDLQEDSSGDEYVPESPSKNSSFDSQLDTSHCTTKDDEDANISRRTRSKFSLSHTPLEVIEEAFMPPDITTDMYDMDCDDDVWKEFLKTFTRPLDEVTKAAEDEDHDPEYNVLADEGIDKVDKEELRADRAVTVSRKEFNCLMAELFEFADIYESNRLSEKNSVTNPILCIEKSQETGADKLIESDLENDPNISVKRCQIPILTQQMRQHVQMLTQNFLLSYEHPEFSDMAYKFKEMLNDLVAGSEGKDASIYHAVNLPHAVRLIENWEQMFRNGGAEVIEYKRYVEKVVSESKDAKLAGREYIVTFPPLLMKTIANSEVFMYSNLLPRIPFKSPSVTKSSHNFFTHGEESLIALFLEQIFLKQDPMYLTPHKKFNMTKISELLNAVLMPHVGVAKIARYIRNRKNPNSEENPIKFLYRNKKAPPAVHYVVPMKATNLLPPCKKSPELLPHLWREHVYPNFKNERSCLVDNQCSYIGNGSQVIIVSYPVQLGQTTNSSVPTSYDVNYSRGIVAKRRIQPRGPLLPSLNQLRIKKQRNKQVVRVDDATSSFIENTATVLLTSRICKEQSNMLPDMPSLGTTPVKNDNGQSNIQTDISNVQDCADKEGNKQSLTFRNIGSLGFQFYKPETVNQVKRSFESISEFSTNNKQDDVTISTFTEKDNPDDINELMIASSTVKTITKKEPSGAEKKRAKMRREFVANLVMATPDDLATQVQKEENFADAFFDKLRQTLTVDDYDKLIDILGHYDESSGEFLDLYKDVQSVLFPTYQELSEEFFLFLTDIQAHKVGQLMPYFLMKDMNRFIKKLHVYFKDQPTQLKKILKCLTDLSENHDITLETIKTTVLPLFKGNAALTDWFLQIFPHEKPTKMLTTGPHEVIDISKELARLPGEDICETVVLPETDDPYGGSSCICPCHNVDNHQFQTRSLHCKNCGLKFIQGKIYIQTGKALRPAVVSFLTNSEKDHSKRLTATRKRADSSPNKQVTSPNKDGHAKDEPRHCNESDDDEHKKKNQKQSKAQQKRKLKSVNKTGTKEVRKSKGKIVAKIKSDTSKTVKNSPKRQTKKRTSVKKNMEYKRGSTPGQQKRPAEEQECTELPESIDEKITSNQSGGCGSVTELLESSQDNTGPEDSAEGTNVNILQHTGNLEDISWTREEDKIILQAFRQSSDNEETFKHISKVLGNRSVVEVKSRFHKLMSLLQQMASHI